MTNRAKLLGSSSPIKTLGASPTIWSLIKFKVVSSGLQNKPTFFCATLQEEILLNEIYHSVFMYCGETLVAENTPTTICQQNVDLLLWITWDLLGRNEH
jgi:hypothetical protein